MRGGNSRQNNKPRRDVQAETTNTLPFRCISKRRWITGETNKLNRSSGLAFRLDLFFFYSYVRVVFVLYALRNTVSLRATKPPKLEHCEPFLIECRTKVTTKILGRHHFVDLPERKTNAPFTCNRWPLPLDRVLSRVLSPRASA